MTLSVIQGVRPVLLAGLSFFLFFGNLLVAQDADVDSESVKSEAVVSATTNSDLFVVYKNPIESTQQTDWEDYGIGDPFIMRYNGVYYLYCSTKDTETGIKCWSSRNLSDWKDEGLCATEPLTQGAYAPEVYYYNGRFFMYTSPHGKGHYVLSAESPTGPFSIVTDNLGFSIDGSVFIDDNGDCFFYHASESGILGHWMSSPISIDPTPISVGAFMNGWTEGPMVIKRQGRYFMTYTGNHVFSRGYRINSGSGTSPLQFMSSSDNPILVNTESDPYGIGHNSLVKGPDLMNYYLVYHSLTGRSAIGAPTRLLNIDRIVFNGSQLAVAGPTITEQKIVLPDFAVYFDQEDALNAFLAGTLVAASQVIFPDFSNSSEETPLQIKDNRLALPKNSVVISRQKLDESFVAEFNISTKSEENNPENDEISQNEEVGVVFCYSDPKNYAKAGIDFAAQKFRIAFVLNGETTTYETALPQSFHETMISSALQSIQIEKSGTNFQFYLNDRSIFQCSNDLVSGAIGYYASQCPGLFGFIGGSNVNRVDSSLTQPIPGSVYAVSCSEFRHLKSEQIATATDGSLYLKEVQTGNSLTFPINIENEGFYDFSLRYSTIDHSATYSLLLDGKPLGNASQPIASTGIATLFQTEIQRRLKLPQGTHQLTFKITNGKIAFSQLSFYKSSDVSAFSADFSGSDDACSYSDGSWTIEDGGLLLKGPRPFGKRLYGDSHWGDYSVETEMTFLENSKNAGLVFRVQNPSNGGSGRDPVMGIDFLQGYFVGLKPDGIVLGKHNYQWTPLVHRYFSVEKNKPYRLKVELRGDNIKVFVNDELLIDYRDNKPFIQGKVGFRGVNSPVRFDELRIEPLKNLNLEN